MPEQLDQHQEVSSQRRLGRHHQCWVEMEKMGWAMELELGLERVEPGELETAELEELEEPVEVEMAGLVELEEDWGRRHWWC